MNDYIIYTDTACDINPELLNKWGVVYSCLAFRFEGSDTEYSNNDMPVKAFYDKMRSGSVAKTAAINPVDFTAAFEDLLKQGKDILYLGFSSGLSTTYNSAVIAAQELKEKYPERKLITVDTLSASSGQGLLVYLTVKAKENGATIEEAAKFAENIRLNICHWFTVDNLVYLKRGGRISPTLAFLGNTLGLKPVLHVDNEGHLISISKVRGRKSSITALADRYGELAKDLKDGTVFISHGDCIDDANTLASIINDKYGATVDIISDIGPVIGAHSGPGTLALFFVGKER